MSSFIVTTTLERCINHTGLKYCWVLTRQLIHSLIFRQPELKKKYCSESAWAVLGSTSLEIAPSTASNCSERRSWQDIHHSELKVLVEPDRSSAHVHTIRNLINLRQTYTLVDPLCLPNSSICRRHIHAGLCAPALLFLTDLSSLINVDNSLISFQPCRMFGADLKPS